VQLAAGAKLPVPELENDTDPVGVDAVPRSVSDTVAVHVEDWLIATGDEHATTVEVDRLITVTANPVASLLFACTESLAE
jgi:hypothetical protein